MAKSIKKRYKILLLGGSVIFLIILSTFILVQTQVVQTWMVHRITDRLNEKSDLNITVGSVDFTFFNKFLLSDLLILDHNSDTLLFASKLNIGLKGIPKDRKKINLTRVSIYEPVFKIITDTNSVNNLSRYLAILLNKKESKDSIGIAVTIQQIDLIGGRMIISSPLDTNSRQNTGINFKYLEVTSLNATIEDFRVEGGAASMLVYRATLIEKSGFKIDRLASAVTIKKGLLDFRTVEIATPNSLIISDEISLTYQDSGAFKNFAEAVRMRFVINQSSLSSSDLAMFIPTLKLDPGNVALSGTITGTLSQLRGRNVSIEAGKLTTIACDFDLSGLPDFENTYIFIDVNNLVTKISELSQLSLIDPDKLPDEIDKEVGVMRFQGTFSGFSTDFVTYGRLITQAGTLSTDISFRPSGKNLFKYSGTLQGSGIEVGKLTSNDSLFGITDFNINVDGSLRSIKEFSATLNGEITHASINNYNYSNINLNGEFSEKRWDGSIKVKDDNLDLEFLGMIDFQNPLPEFDFTLSVPNARLFELNIDKADTNSFLSLLIEANFTGDKVDNLDGEIRFVNSTYIRQGKKLEIIDGLLQTYIENGKPALDFKTDYVNAYIRGDYNFGSLPFSIRTILAGLIPSRFDIPDPPKQNLINSFDLKIVFNNTQEINDFFDTNTTISNGTELNISYLIDNKISVNLKSESVRYTSSELKNIEFQMVIADSTSITQLKSSSFTIAGKPELKDFTLDMTSSPDSVNIETNWNDKALLLNKGSLSLTSVFSKSDEGDRTLLTVNPTEVFVKNSLWEVNRANLEFIGKSVTIDNAIVSSDSNFYHVSGIISESPADTLMVDLSGINLKFLNELSKKQDTEKLSLDIEGSISGKILLTGILKDIMIETDGVVINDFRMINQNYGDIYLKTTWDNQKKIVAVNLFNDIDGVNAINLNGTFNPDAREMDFIALTDRFPIDILNPLLYSFASGIEGFASGEIHLYGKLKEPLVTGALFVDQGKIKIDYLQTEYFFNDSIRFNNNGIRFNNITGSDERGNAVKINGIVSHKYFKEFGFDIAVSPNQAMALNTRPKDNDIFYGTAFATGLVTIKGSEGNIALNVSARTDRNTSFYVPMNSSQTIGEYSFITFTDTENPTGDVVITPVVQGRKSDGKFELNLDLEVTPDAEVQLVLDSKAGDVMKGKGSGRLNMNLNQYGDFTIAGDYIISSGEYLFTLGNIVNKRFNVTSGSKISWNGDVEKAEIDIRAVYKLEASLYDLLQMEEYRDRIPVECHLHLTDLLLNPVIKFDIILPTADQTTRSYFQTLTATDEAMSRQFLYLLVINQFYPDPAFLSSGSTASSSLTGTGAIGTTTTEMLSNQLSNWLSQISNDFDIGFVYRPGNEISSQELELALSTQLLNDRVTINGNVDVGNSQNASSATNFTGVFDVEYKINEKVRLKFFNRSNDNILYETAPYTQGLGILYRQDFDKFKNLFRKEPKSEGKKEKEPKVRSNNQK